MAPRSRRCRVSARVSTSHMPTTPWACSSSSRLRRDRQLDGHPGGIADHVAGHPDPARLVVLVVPAGVADVRRGGDHHLPVVAGVGQRLLVARHRRGEDRLTEGLPDRTEGPAAEGSAVLEHQKSRRAGLEREMSGIDRGIRGRARIGCEHDRPFLPHRTGLKGWLTVIGSDVVLRSDRSLERVSAGSEKLPDRDRSLVRPLAEPEQMARRVDLGQPGLWQRRRQVRGWSQLTEPSLRVARTRVGWRTPAVTSVGGRRSIMNPRRDRQLSRNSTIAAGRPRAGGPPLRRTGWTGRRPAGGKFASGFRRSTACTMPQVSHSVAGLNAARAVRRVRGDGQGRKLTGQIKMTARTRSG